MGKNGVGCRKSIKCCLEDPGCWWKNREKEGWSLLLVVAGIEEKLLGLLEKGQQSCWNLVLLLVLVAGREEELGLMLLLEKRKERVRN